MPPVVTREPVQRPAAPGVVPPPAAPIYSMRQPEPTPRVDNDLRAAVAERLTAAREAQQLAQARIQSGARPVSQRTRTAPSPATSFSRRPPQQAAPALKPRAARQQAPQAFDPLRCAQAAMLNLAWSWQEAGSPIRAIHTYMELLCRYPGTPAADAAVADLAALTSKLAEEGQFHTALGIYEQLEHLL